MTTHRAKVLAIDDTPENLMLLATALEKEYDFQLAASGAVGIALATASPPDLILLDVMMPEMDGYETCRRLKADPRLAPIPVIFITALADVESEITGLSVGGADFITKPIRIELVRQRMRNILALTHLSLQLQRSEERLRYVMEATGDGIWDWEIASDTVVHNAKWCEILGLPLEYLEHPMAEYLQRIHPDHRKEVEVACEACLRDIDYFSCEYRVQHAAGHYIWIADHGKVIQRDENGLPVRIVGSTRNIDLRKRHEEEIERLAFYDTLTGLANRRLMQDRLAQAIDRLRRSSAFGALLFLDMDRFKELNDTFGHAMGDLLLKEVGMRLSQGIRASDSVARFGGDEFVVMLEGFSANRQQALNDARTLAEKLLTSLNQPYQLGVLKYNSTPSIGLTLFNGEEQSLDDILKRGDIAMYRAKAAGRNRVCVYDEGEL